MSTLSRRSLSALAMLCLLFSLTLTAQCAIIRVKTTGVDTNNGSSWALAKQTVQAAINTAVSGDEVWVAAGTYVQCITMKGGVSLYGGFAGTESAREERNWTTNVTILDGNQAGSVVTATSTSSSTYLDGFTVRNGRAVDGGGVYAMSGLTISHNIITGNTATANGAGVYAVFSSIRDSLIVKNTGEGVNIPYASGMSGSTVADNTGRGVYAESSIVSNNIIALNQGGIYFVVGLQGREEVNCLYNPGYADYLNSPTPGWHDISADPLFIDRSANNYRLSFNSPCRDAGDNSRIHQFSTMDLDGRPRIVPVTAGVVDMGCYEWDQFGVVITSPTINPTYVSDTLTLSISGTAKDEIGTITAVNWTNDRGGSGTCTGTTSWFADGIALQPGLNVITVTAPDDTGHVPTATLKVAYYTRPTVLTVTSPATDPSSTTASKIIATGSVDGDVPIASVKWSLNGGSQVPCTGTNSWSTATLSLRPEFNTVTITATDVVGTVTAKTLSVTRLPITIREARTLPNQASVYITDAVVTSVNTSFHTCNVEDSGRSSGIVLGTSTNRAVGQRLTFTGEIFTGYSENQINVVSIISSTPGTALAPIVVTSQAIGNDRTETLNFCGLDISGVVMRYAGEVTFSNTDGPRYIYVDDGGGYQDGKYHSIAPGVYVQTRGIRIDIPYDTTMLAVGDKVVVTGVKRIQKENISSSQGAYVNGVWYPHNTPIYIPTLKVETAAGVKKP